jgi:hypothetical protein
MVSMIVADLPEKKDVVCGIGGIRGLRCDAVCTDGHGNDFETHQVGASIVECADVRFRCAAAVLLGFRSSWCVL